jgi:hypothetical protein
METRFQHGGSPLAQFAAGIVRRAGERVLEIFNRNPDARLVLHSYPFTAEIVTRIKEIAEQEEAPEDEKEIAQLAAWFLQVGYMMDYRQPTRYSLSEAERFLLREQYPEGNRRRVLQCLTTVAEKQPLKTVADRLLSDAFQLTSYVIDFQDRMSLWRLEWELLLDRRLSDYEWAKLQLQYLLQLQLHTHYARTQYEPRLGQLIHEQKEAVEKSKQREAQDGQPHRRFHQLEKKRNPTRAMQTFFRTNFRNHINLSSIADNKANIMISVNSILISVLISILTYRNISETQPIILMPGVIFLVTGLASLIFAVLSARPKVTKLHQLNEKKLDPKQNIVFFGNFVHLDLEEYEEAMDAVFRDDALIYGNMTRDLYHLGKVLDKKYRYLAISYNIFMVGFIATVGSFLFLLFTSGY